MGERTYTVPNRFGIQAILMTVTLFAVTVTLTQAIEASLRVVAPLMSFVVLIGLAQMLFGNLPRTACTLVGAILFPACAWIDPLFNGRMKLQALESIDLFWLLTCGGIAGYSGGVLLAGLFLIADQVRAMRGPSVYSVPRRFGMGTLLLATTLFAMLFAVLQWARASPEQLFFYTAFVATVSLAQMVFERSPRWASILAGGFFLPLSMEIIPLVRGRGLWRNTDSITLVQWTLMGLAIGYLGGAVVAGVFLGSDYVARLLLGRARRSRSPSGPLAVSVPFEVPLEIPREPPPVEDPQSTPQPATP